MSTANTPSTVIVSGASRGIGLQFVKSYLDTASPIKLLALSRNLSKELSDLISQHPSRITHITTDLTDPSSINATAETIKETVPSVDILINVAGVLGNGKGSEGPERSVKQLHYDWMLRSFQVNVLGHSLLTSALVPVLSKGTQSPSLTKIVNISARVGSIEDNR